MIKTRKVVWEGKSIRIQPVKPSWRASLQYIAVLPRANSQMVYASKHTRWQCRSELGFVLRYSAPLCSNWLLFYTGWHKFVNSIRSFYFVLKSIGLIRNYVSWYSQCISWYSQCISWYSQCMPLKNALSMSLTLSLNNIWHYMAYAWDHS